MVCTYNFLNWTEETWSVYVSEDYSTGQIQPPHRGTRGRDVSSGSRPWAKRGRKGGGGGGRRRVVLPALPAFLPSVIFSTSRVLLLDPPLDVLATLTQVLFLEAGVESPRFINLSAHGVNTP